MNINRKLANGNRSTTTKCMQVLKRSLFTVMRQKDDICFIDM